MIPKSGNRFSEKIMLNRKMGGESDSTQPHETLTGGRQGCHTGAG
jgi:hypothetical protein